MSPAKKLPLVHPGEILLEEFLKPLGMQRDYDLQVARDEFAAEIESQIQPRNKAA